ncbi:MAG: DUF4838 domain-containing protein [Lentisphaerae bacterium]|nr:DUF4838 domain-containing protein [Lentisphaerota bacterium]
MDRTRELALREAGRYGVDADFVIKDDLPSFEIISEKNRVTIFAPNEVELLYGVYSFAEEFLGWSFFAPGRDRHFPQRVREIPADGVLIQAKKPLLKRRGFIQEFPFNSETGDLFDWMAKNKFNYLLTWMKYYDELSDELKQFALDRGVKIESGHHNFDYWIPGLKYAPEHPEFFAEVNGKRITPSGNSELLMSEQLCTTNKELRKEIVRRMDEYCRKHPEIKTISLVPNDGFGWCECEECSKFYDKNEKGDAYSISKHVYKADRIYHNMVQDIAAQLKEVQPDMNLTFCAYVNYCAPSEGMRLEKGMAVHMAPYWHCINHAMDDPSCEINSRYLADIEKWCKVKNGGEVNVYEYYMGVNFYLSLPMIHWEKMFREVKKYNEMGVDGVLTQFHVPHWSVYGINYRMLGRAGRGEDEKKSISDMMDDLFGSDAAEGEAFYREIEKAMHEMGTCHVPYPRSFLKRISMEQLEYFRTLAVNLAAKAPQESFRKELVVWCEYMVRFKKLFDKLVSGTAVTDEVDELLKWVHSYSDMRLFVLDRFDSYFEGMREAIRQGTPWVHYNFDWEDAYILEHDRTLQ